MKKAIILSALILLLVAGCARNYTWVIKSDPPERIISNDLYSIKLNLSPPDRYSYKSFELVIVNKTSKDIELIWDKTLYICGGQTSGGFTYEGVIYKDRNMPKQSDVIFANGTFNKTIFPSNFISFRGQYGWYSDYMPNGENGVYLTLKINGEEYHEKLLLDILTDYVKNN